LILKWLYKKPFYPFIQHVWVKSTLHCFIIQRFRVQLTTRGRSLWLYWIP
jgi:hypothetical protein